MANKTIGRQYLVFPEAANNNLRRGHYYYGGKCKQCSRNVFLDEYEAYEFVSRAKNSVEKIPWFHKFLNVIPRLKISFVKKEEAETRWVG